MDNNVYADATQKIKTVKDGYIYIEILDSRCPEKSSRRSDGPVW